MAYYLTYDLGTSALKTAIVGEDGRPVVVVTTEYAFTCLKPDWAEMPAEVYWRAVTQSTRKAIAESGLSPLDISAIGFSSQGQTFVPLDSGGTPIRDFIVWVDRRAEKLAREWSQGWLTRDRFREVTGYPWVAAELSIFKLAWLMEREPEVRGAAFVLCLPDYIIFKMTGERATDHNIAQHTGLYNVIDGKWEPDFLAAAGITEDQLPRVVRPGTVVGTLLPEAADQLGLAVGTTVCAGTNDQIAGAIGVGNVHTGIASETTGTALAVIATTADVLKDAKFTVGRHAIPGLGYAMPFANTSAIVLKWFRDMAAPDLQYGAFLEGVESIPIGCGGLTVLPHFSGSVLPESIPEARGAIAGLTLGHTRMHIARAIMESCACLLADCLDPLAGAGIELEIVRSMGGAARSDVWLQMKADLLQIPVERPDHTDAASVGAAAITAAGTGKFRSIPEAVQTWYHPSQVFQPNPASAEAYREVLGRYRELYRKMYH